MQIKSQVRQPHAAPPRACCSNSDRNERAVRLHGPPCDPSWCLPLHVVLSPSGSARGVVVVSQETAVVATGHAQRTALSDAAWPAQLAAEDSNLSEEAVHEI